MGVLSTLRNFFIRKEAKRLSGTSEEKASSDYKTSESSSKISSVNTHHSQMKSATNSMLKNAVSSPAGSTKHSSSSGNGYNFLYRDGRRYHADTEVAYVLPNDDDGTWIFIYMYIYIYMDLTAI
jgi:hypothetical protein